MFYKIKNIFNKHKGGVLDEAPSLLLYDYETVCGTSDVEIPETYRIPQDRIPDCRDQGATGQCAAFASTNILQILNQVETGNRIRFSTTYAYGRHRTEDERTMSGMYVSDVMKRMCVKGSVPEEYISIPLCDVPDAYDCITGLSNIEELDRIAEQYHIKTYIGFKSADQSKKNREMKQALLTYNVPLLGVMDYGDVSHAVSIVGWDKTKWYFMNSWGDNNGKYDGIDNCRYDSMKYAYLMLDAKNTPKFPFVDVPASYWGYNAIKHCYNAGIINGMNATEFAPEGTLTRAQVCQAMYVLAQKMADFYGEEFADATRGISVGDVKVEDWFYAPIRYCLNKGIVKTKNKTMFYPNEAISREEFCDVVASFIDKVCKGTKYMSGKTAFTFDDVDKNSEYANAIYACYYLDIIKGVDERNFMPKGHLKRSHLCQMIYKLIKTVEKYEA